MITLSLTEKLIVAKVFERVFGVAIAAEQIKGLRVDNECNTVHIITTHGLYSLGKDYFKELVAEFKKPVKVRPNVYEIIGTTNVYTITHGVCNCKAAQYRRTCKHIKAYREAV